MKKITGIGLFLLAALFAFAQDTKNIVYDAHAERRNVGDFKAVEVSNAIALYLSQGKECAVAISAENETAKVRTEVKNGVLKIYLEEGVWRKWNRNELRVKAYVTVKNIERITASGACMVRITDKLSSPDLKIVLTGASNLKGEIKAEMLKMDISGASSATATVTGGTLGLVVSGASSGNFTGTAGNLQVDVSGASNLKAYDLAANTCSAEASGASSVRVQVTGEFIRANASGASSIRYKGNASARNFEASGASSIKKDSR